MPIFYILGLRRDLFYLLDYITGQSGFAKKKKKKKKNLVQWQIGKKYLSRVHLWITEKTLPY